MENKEIIFRPDTVGFCYEEQGAGQGHKILAEAFESRTLHHHVLEDFSVVAKIRKMCKKTWGADTNWKLSSLNIFQGNSINAASTRYTPSNRGKVVYEAIVCVAGEVSASLDEIPFTVKEGGILILKYVSKEYMSYSFNGMPGSTYIILSTD